MISNYRRRTMDRICHTPAFHTVHAFFLVVTLAVGPANGVQQWNNLGTGAAAGNWSDAANWTPAGVPTSLLDASINNGGEARLVSPNAASALSLAIGKNGGTGHFTSLGGNIQIQQGLDLGLVDGTVATGPVTVSANGTGTLSNVASVAVGIGQVDDLNVGQSTAGTLATATAMGSLFIENLGSLSISGDLDIGQTSGTGTAMGNGAVTMQQVSGVVNIGDGIDLGTTSATGAGQSTSTGSLTLTNVADFRTSDDLDVAQSTGSGFSFGTGMLAISGSTISIGNSFDLGKVVSSLTGNNRAVASATISSSTVSVGFGSTPLGSLALAQVFASNASRGVSQASLILDDVDLMSANDVIVGELSQGGTNSQNSAQAMLTLIDSQLETRDLYVAERLAGTVGSLSGQLRMTRSLAKVGSLLKLNNASTLQLDLSGLDRSTGEGLPNDYSAIDADSATIGGRLEIQPIDSFADPSTRGTVDEFHLITTLFGLSGSFQSMAYQGNSLALGSNYVGANSQGSDGLFRILQVTSTEVLLRNYLALPGDANGDLAVDGSDFNIWNANKFTAGANWSRGDFNGDGSVDGSDFNIWNANKFTAVGASAIVPEPATGGIAVVLFFLTYLSRKTPSV